MLARVVGGLVFIGALCFLPTGSSAQHFRRMDDRQAIELTIDMLRKGIQQEDTVKIGRVLASQVTAGGKSVQSREVMVSRFQVVFESSKAADVPWQPVSTAGNIPLQASSFWDFDFVEPVIDIVGDTATVHCDLVLRAMPTESGDQGTLQTIRTQLRLVAQGGGRKRSMSTDDFQLVWDTGGALKVPRSWKVVDLGSVIEVLSIRSVKALEDTQE